MKESRLLFPGMAALALLPILNAAGAQGKPARPNIIFIMADDLGYGDIGCYGQQYIKTPNIDRMAREGIRFTNHYSGAPVSAPARCCLMTGMNLGHSYVRNNFEIKGDEYTQGQMPLPENTETVARMLKRAGYATAIIGKWGLGSMSSTGAPNKQGFDFFYGYNDQNHAHNHYPSFLWRNDKIEKLDNPVINVHPEFDKNATHDLQEYKQYQGNDYSLDLMTDEALKFIDSNKQNPFFLYLTYVVPHKALQVPDESLEMYNGVFDEKPYIGGGGYTPHPRPYSAYSAMITRMDQKIGEVIEKLKVLGIEKNTIVIFTSDNGPAGGGGTDSRFFNSSGGLRGSKSQVYEGGIREPFVVRWPGKIKAGTVTDHPSGHFDFMATVGELTGQKVNNTDGVSYLPALLGKSKKQKQHEYMYWEFGGQIAVRMGNLKGVKRISRNPQPAWEIYDLATDPAESKNVAEQYPEMINKFDEVVGKRTPSHHEPWNFMTRAGQNN
jgi:arylsulfatase A-like enzyme